MINLYYLIENCYHGEAVPYDYNSDTKSEKKDPHKNTVEKIDKEITDITKKLCVIRKQRRLKNLKKTLKVLQADPDKEY